MADDWLAAVALSCRRVEYIVAGTAQQRDSQAEQVTCQHLTAYTPSCPPPSIRCDDAGLRLVERHARGVTWLGLYGYRRVVPPARTSYSRWVAVGWAAGDCRTRHGTSLYRL